MHIPKFPLLSPPFYNHALGERFANHLRVFLQSEDGIDQSSIALSLFNALSWTLTSIINTDVPFAQRHIKAELLRELSAGLTIMAEKLSKEIFDDKQDPKRPRA